MIHVDKTIKQAVTAQIAGGTLMMISAHAPLSVCARVGVFTAGAALCTAGTIVGESRVEQLKFQREMNEAINRYRWTMNHYR